MSNLTVGGYDRFRQRHFSYYETIAGGAGAAPGHPGASGIHTHMTNTLNTPIEALEAYYPMRITEYRIRRRSGGRGRFAGGDGLVRELECLAESNVSLLTERRTLAPYGLAGGGAGTPGANYLVRGRRTRPKLPGKTNVISSPAIAYESKRPAAAPGAERAEFAGTAEQATLTRRAICSRKCSPTSPWSGRGVRNRRREVCYLSREQIEQKHGRERSDSSLGCEERRTLRSLYTLSLTRERASGAAFALFLQTP